MSKNAKLREKRKWAIEKPKLDNARRLRGIYFIDPEDMEFKEIIQKARRKLETPMAPAMPCKICKKNKHGETRGKTNDFKSKFACILEASESTIMRMEETLPKYHEDHIAGKGDNSQQHYNVVHKYWKFPNRSVQTSGFVYHDTNGQNHCPVWKTQSFLSSEICMVILWQDYYGKGNLRKSYWNTVGRRFPIGNAHSYTVKKNYSYLCMWMTSNWLETKYQSDVESIKQRSWIGRTNIFPWSWKPVLKDNVK